MKVYEFGKEHTRSFAMFQCAAEPWWVFKASAEEMARDYHVYLFIADGHDELGTKFVSLEKYAKDAAEYLRKQNVGQVDGMYGVSMGGAAVIRFLATEDILVEKAIIDAGITPYPYPKWICRLISVKDWITVMLGTRSLKIMKAVYTPERWTPKGEDPEAHYRALMKFYKQHYSPRTIYNVFWSTDNYSMPDPVPRVDTKIEYWYGEEEKKARENEHDIEFVCRTYSEHQKKSMSMLFRGKAIFKPLNTGRIDEQVSCVREWIANIFFYTKNGTTIMIDAGYNYARLQEKMGWLDLDPASIRHILITHQDTDHVGALERDSELLFKDAMVYIGEIENRYLTGEVRRKVFHGAYKLPMVKIDNQRTLLRDGEVFQIGDIRIECILVPGHTWGHLVYLIDDEYLFTGDTIWFGADGGYSFISTLAEDNKLAVQSLEKLEKNLRARNTPIKIITGHTGWTDNLDFAFRHRTEICKPFTKKYTDPSAPYDGYIEDDDTEKSARSVLLRKVAVK